MKKVCANKGVQCLIPIIDVETRWNSTYDMLVRAYNIRDVITDTIFSHKDMLLINLLLTEQDWNCIAQLIQILKPMKDVTLLTSQSNQALCITNVLPLYSYCTEVLGKSMAKFEDTDDIYSGMEAAREKLNHYYDNVSPLIGIALLLDPCSKKQFFKEVARNIA